MANRIPTAVARKDFASVLDDSARGERIKLTRYDKTIAVVISKDDLAKLEECERARGAAEAKRRPAPRRRTPTR
jgi:hypothetical protein